jgi:DUF4097 and DUF4098 domain-containing protein YvlB
MNRKILFTLVWTLAVIPCSTAPVLSEKAGTQVAGEQEHKLQHGGKVSVRNPVGPISITGWDRDTIQATAVRTAREETVRINITEDSQHAGVVSITPALEGRRGGHEVHLEVKLPRYAQIESANAHGGDVEISGIEGSVNASSGSGNLVIKKVGPLSAHTGSGDVKVEDVTGQTNVSTGSGDISLSRVGSVEARAGSGDISVNGVKGSAKVQTGSGDVSARDINGDFIAKLTSGDLELENVTGLVNVTVTSGGVRVHNSESDVRVNTISGDMTIQCAKGHVELSSASGSMSLTGIGDDVEASTTSGDINYTGKMRTGGRYRMKSTSGQVHMAIPADAPGFTATLSSYSGEIETDFPLNVESSLQRGPINRRIIGRYGDGQAQIMLDSFSQGVKLSKASAGAVKNCK